MALDPRESLLFMQMSLEKRKVFLELQFQLTPIPESCGALVRDLRAAHPESALVVHRMQSKQLWNVSKQEERGRQSDLQAANHNLLFDSVCLFVRYCSILRAEREQGRWKLHQRGAHFHGLS